MRRTLRGDAGDVPGGRRSVRRGRCDALLRRLPTSARFGPGAPSRASVRRYRNRRVGEFLKELRLTEGRGTGVPSIFKAMRDNGSPEPRFETDAERTHFTTTLPIHPLASAAEIEAMEPAAPTASDYTDAGELLRSAPFREVLRLSLEPQSRVALQQAAGVSDPRHFARTYLQPLIKAGFLTMTNPDRPKAPNQRYRTTPRGKAILDELSDGV